MTTRADYEHHNEDADRIWWEEVGRHEEPDEGMSKEDYMQAMTDDPDHELWR